MRKKGQRRCLFNTRHGEFGVLIEIPSGDENLPIVYQSLMEEKKSQLELLIRIELKKKTMGKNKTV